MIQHAATLRREARIESMRQFYEADAARTLADVGRKFGISRDRAAMLLRGRIEPRPGRRRADGPTGPTNHATVRPPVAELLGVLSGEQRRARHEAARAALDNDPAVQLYRRERLQHSKRIAHDPTLSAAKREFDLQQCEHDQRHRKGKRKSA